MGRLGFMIGLLTGIVCATALYLRPAPERYDGAMAAAPPAATYRMAGEVRKNTCAAQVVWPPRWRVGYDELHIGDRRLYGRRQRAAVVYEATRVSDDGCLRADWRIKLAPRGHGIAGTAAWEVAPLQGAGCIAGDRLPCLFEAEVYGLPEAEP